MIYIFVHIIITKWLRCRTSATFRCNYWTESTSGSLPGYTDAHAFFPLPEKFVGMAACTDFTLKVGDSFSSFADLERAINHIQHTTAVQLWRRESKTLVSQKKRFPGGRASTANADLRYYLLVYCCVCGGKRFKSRSTGDRIHARYVYNIII